MMLKFKCASVLQRFSIRKSSFGVASVLLGTLAFLGGSVVSANEVEGSQSDPVLVSTVEQELPVLEPVSVVNSDVDGDADVSSSNGENVVLKLEEVQPTIPESSLSPLPDETKEELADVSHESSSSLAELTKDSLTTDSPFRLARHSSTAIGDDYPQVWKNGVVWQSVDNWNMYVKECVSFAAYRLSAVNGFELPSGYGSAHTWGHIARSAGYRVDMTPAVGAIAWMDRNQHGAFSYGHVAWVSHVDGDRVELEEYNFNNPHAYHRRTIHKHQVSGYIHFKDVTSPLQSPKTQVSYPSSSSKLAPSGTYHFTEYAGIKSEPKLSNPDLAYYTKGYSVIYDSVVEADGHEWISYLSSAGNRRYIAVNKLPAKAKLTGTVTVSHHADGFDVLVTNVPTNADVKTVKLGVWTTADGTDDLVWYTARQQGDGTYKVSVSLEQHDDERGEYRIKLQYVKTNRDKVTVSTTKTTVTDPLVEKPQPVRVSLPPSGTYHFTQRASIKAEPKQSSPELAYYDKGYSVNYDSIVTSEGRQWLSYLSYAGNRRYVELP